MQTLELLRLPPPWPPPPTQPQQTSLQLYVTVCWLSSLQGPRFSQSWQAGCTQSGALSRRQRWQCLPHPAQGQRPQHKLPAPARQQQHLPLHPADASSALPAERIAQRMVGGSRSATAACASDVRGREQ